ncbi:MAG: cupin domain-containing protein [Actinomycetota bacterium]
MGVRKTPGTGSAESLGEVEGRLRGEGLGTARRWSNGPGDTYGWHDHPYHKVLYCLLGGITFHMHGRDVGLGPGDRLDIEPGTEHAATVGPQGVSCIEASRP